MNSYPGQLFACHWEIHRVMSLGYWVSGHPLARRWLFLASRYRCHVIQLAGARNADATREHFAITPPSAAFCEPMCLGLIQEKRFGPGPFRICLSSKLVNIKAVSDSYLKNFAHIRLIFPLQPEVCRSAILASGQARFVNNGSILRGAGGMSLQPLRTARRRKIRRALRI